MGSIATNNKKYRLKLNSIEKIEELLQIAYNEEDKIIVETQEQINKLTLSSNLNSEIMESKTKYAKAMKDFIDLKDKAIGRKLEMAKLMSDIVKHNGNVKEAVESDDIDWSSFRDEIEDKSNSAEAQTATYILKK